MIGEIVTHYQVTEKLGRGGMGIVYRATDTRLGRSVALKFLPDELAKSERALRRFQREARAASALNHPNICTVYDIGEHRGRQFIAMELLEGQTLREFIQGRPLAFDVLLDLSLQLIDALEAAHAAGIVHRDIKPTNVFVNQRGQVKVLDFGLAKWVLLQQAKPGTEEQPGTTQSVTADAALSMSCMPVGTVAYMSPEQSRGEEVDGRADLFSVGLVMYEMGTGTPAFRGSTAAVIFHEVLSQDPAPASELNPDINPRLEEIILRLIEKDRDMRYQTAADLRADLKRLKRDWNSDRSATGSSISSDRPRQRLFPAKAADCPSDRRGPRLAAGRPANPQAVWRRHKAASATVGMIVALVTLAALLWPRAAYLPCIVLDNFEGGSESIQPDLVRCAVERGLLQFADITVVHRQEYRLIESLKKGRQEASGSAAQSSSLLQRLVGFRREAEAARPALVVSARIHDSPAGVQLRVKIVNQGKSMDSSIDCRGAGDLLERGIDELVLSIWRLFNGQPETGKDGPSGYRRVAQLLSPNWDAVVHYWRGAEAWKRLDLTSAQKELRWALEIDREFALAHLMLSEIFVFQNQWSLAQTEIKTALLQQTALTEIDRLRAEALFARAAGNPHEERTYLQKLVELLPHRKEYRYELAESYFHTADVDQAIPKYLDALELDAEYALVHNHLGLCYAWKGDHTLAIESMRKYLEIDRSANAFDSIGDAYLCAGAYEEAARYKSMAVQQDPTLNYARRSLPYIDVFRGRARKAEGQLLALLDESVDKIEKARYCSALAFTYYSKGDLEQASKICRQGLNLVMLAPNDAPADELTWMNGLIELRRDNMVKARLALEQLRTVLDSNSITATNYKPAYKYWLHLLASIRAEEGRRGEAALALDDLRGIKDKLGYWSTPYDRAFFFDSIGVLYERINRIADAEGAFRDALAYNPHYGPARFHLARLLQGNGQFLEARREVELFLKEWQGAEPDAADLVAVREIVAQLVAPADGPVHPPER